MPESRCHCCARPMGCCDSRVAVAPLTQVSDSHVKLSLLAHEKGPGWGMNAVTTITFFDGELPEKYLEARVAEIIAANPWLTGTRACVGSPNDVLRLLRLPVQPRSRRLMAKTASSTRRRWTPPATSACSAPRNLPCTRKWTSMTCRLRYRRRWLTSAR